MAGLTGIVANQDTKIDVENLLLKMCQVIRHEERQKTDSYVSGTTGIGRVHISILNPERQPIFNEDRTLCIMMDGEIYDYQNIKNELISKGHKFLVDNDPEFILHLYEEYGNEFIHKLNGCFSIVIWNEKLKKLLIVNDRYGWRPIYYTNINGYLLFASEVKAIIQCGDFDNSFKKEVDDRSITEFFSFGYILGNKTFFKFIELIPPASILSYTDGNLSIEQYWDYDVNKDYNKYSEEYYLEKLHWYISQAVERRMTGNHKIGVLLSGGLDSRTIIASIDKKYYPIDTITYGKSNCNDAKLAQIISNKLGTIHHFYEFKPEDIIANAEKVVYVTDGMLNIFNAPRMQTYDEIIGFNDITLHGWIGDSTMGDYLDGYLIKLIDFQDNFKIFKRLCNSLSIDILRNLFSNNYFPIVEKNLDMSRNYIIQMGENIKLSANRLIYYNLKERQRRLITVGFIYMRNYIESRTPFSDYDYLDFSLQIPPTFKYGKKLYKRMILETFPQLIDIPYGSTGYPLYKSSFELKIMQLSKLMINKITGMIFGNRLFSDEEKNLADYGKWIRENKNLREYVDNILLDERTLNRNYFNREYIKNILGEHMSGEKDYSTLIGLLITFELWNRQFIDESESIN